MAKRRNRRPHALELQALNGLSSPLTFHPLAWEQYLYWQRTDKAMLRKLNSLIEDCLRHPFEGIGKPELLRGDLSGFWSRRIDREHRLVYRATATALEIVQCRYHY